MEALGNKGMHDQDEHGIMNFAHPNGHSQYDMIDVTRCQLSTGFLKYSPFIVVHPEGRSYGITRSIPSIYSLRVDSMVDWLALCQVIIAV